MFSTSSKELSTLVLRHSTGSRENVQACCKFLGADLSSNRTTPSHTLMLYMIDFAGNLHVYRWNLPK